MKRIFIGVAFLSIALFGSLSAQETDDPDNGSVPEESTTVVDSDNPGMGLLDQATEAKLRASTPVDLIQVIVLCQRAKKAGLSGENLKYCNQLLASTQLQRGLVLAQALDQPNARDGNWQDIRQRALNDLEDAVNVIKDHPAAFMRIAQLNLLPDGNENRAKEALQLVIQSANNDPEIQFQAALRLVDLETEAEKREAVASTAAKSGNPRIVLLHAGTLFELKRNDEARNVLQKLIEAESNNTDLHHRIVAILTEVREYKTAMSIIDKLREKETESESQYRIDQMAAKVFAKMGQYEDALKLLNSLYTNFQENKGLMLTTLLLRADVHFEMDNFTEALKDLEAAEKMLPNFPPDVEIEVLEKKHHVLMAKENYNDALDVVKKLQSMIEQPIPIYLLWEMEILNKQKKYAASIEIVQKLREQYPDAEAQWILVLIGIYSKEGAYDKALTLVEEQLKEEPEELRWIVAKSQVFSEQKKWDEAVSWLESCLQKDPESKAINLLLIETMWLSKKNYKATKDRIRPLLAKEPDNLALLHLDSQTSISLGLHADAVKVLTKIIELAPEDHLSLNNLAWILCTSPIDSVRNGRRAVELAEKAGQLTNYKRAFILSTLAAAYAEAGDFEKAREWSQKSVEVAKQEKGSTEEERKELLEHLQKEWDCFKQDMPFRELMEE